MSKPKKIQIPPVRTENEQAFEVFLALILISVLAIMLSLALVTNY